MFFSSQPVVLSLRVTFDSLQPSCASSPKMTATKDYSALPPPKYACIAGYLAVNYSASELFGGRFYEKEGGTVSAPAEGIGRASERAKW